MDGVFSWRRARANDLPDCLALHPAKNGAETVGNARALKAWHQLLELTHATRSAVVEVTTKGQVEIVGFGLAAFVTKSFSEDEVRHPRPGLNARLIESIAAEHSVCATYEEVRDANTRGDLEQVILDTSWKHGPLDATQVDEVRVLLGRAYQYLFAGYRFSRIISEMVDERDLWHIRGSRSFQVIDRFEHYRGAHPDTTWNSDRALYAVTFETMREDPHSVAAELFHHRRLPRFAFRRGEQELLEAALDGADDLAASKSLFVSLPAIKRRWANIFERVAAMRPDLCPADGDGTRGIQKRQRILTYLRNHPEELRPFNFEKPS
jgi:hypothetical protein